MMDRLFAIFDWARDPNNPTEISISLHCRVHHRFGVIGCCQAHPIRKSIDFIVGLASIFLSSKIVARSRLTINCKNQTRLVMGDFVHSLVVVAEFWRGSQ
jgi:hypothetical protein